MQMLSQERMEPLGIIVFACIMGTLGCSISVEAVRQLLAKEKSHVDNLPLVIGTRFRPNKGMSFHPCVDRGSSNRPSTFVVCLYLDLLLLHSPGLHTYHFGLTQA